MKLAEVDEFGVVLLIDDDVSATGYLSLVSLLNKTTNTKGGNNNA